MDALSTEEELLNKKVKQVHGILQLHEYLYPAADKNCAAIRSALEGTALPVTSEDEASELASKVYSSLLSAKRIRRRGSATAIYLKTQRAILRTEPVW